MPVPNYALADQPIVVDVANVALPALGYLARSAGANNYPLGGSPDLAIPKYMLGFALRFGLQSMNTIQPYLNVLTQRFDDRFGASVTATDALVFADDITLAGTLAGICDCTVAKIYRTAAHYFLATYDTGLRDFFNPAF